MTEIRIDPTFEALIPPLGGEAYDALEASLLEHGCRDPLTTWQGILVDGHHRYRVCMRHGIAFQAESLPDEWDRARVVAWMLRHQIGRRNLSVDQQVVLTALHGGEHTVGTMLQREQAAQLVAAGHTEEVVLGELTLRRAHNRYCRTKAPRGPKGDRTTDPYIPEGHELSGVSTLHGPDGEMRARWDKTRTAGAEVPPVEVPPNHLITRTASLERGDGTTVLQWRATEAEKVAQWHAAKDAVVSFVAEHTRAVSAVPESGELLDSDIYTLYPLGDPHIGMLAWAREVGSSFDLKTAQRELLECVTQLIRTSPASERCAIVNLGDFWHAQDDQQRTPARGHKLDVDGRAAKVGEVGLQLMASLVDRALEHHRHVDVRNLGGNHDPNMAFWLAAWLQARYANEPRVTVHDGVQAYQYDVFGRNLLGYTHGHGCKPADLAEVMATDVPELWGQARYRYWHTGHRHHLERKELRGCVVDTHRTLAGRDAWHHNSGYRAGRSLRSITYHRRWGLCAEYTVGIERVQEALGASHA